MKCIVIPTLLGLGLHGVVTAQSMLSGIPAPTHDWGCEVLLCLANPAGPMAVSACVPPIKKLYRELLKRHAIPTCRMASGPSGRSYAVMASRYYDPCPAGTNELGEGSLAQLAAPMVGIVVPPTPSGAPSTFSPGRPDTTYAGIDSGDGIASPTQDNGAPDKVCVAGPAGTRNVRDGLDIYNVPLYRQVFVSAAQQ